MLHSNTPYSIGKRYSDDLSFGGFSRADGSLPRHGGRPSHQRPDGLVDSWDLRDQRTRGLKGYASGEEPTVGQDEFEGRDESDEASLMEQGKNGVWRTKQVW